MQFGGVSEFAQLNKIIRYHGRIDDTLSKQLTIFGDDFERWLTEAGLETEILSLHNRIETECCRLIIQPHALQKSQMKSNVQILPDIIFSFQNSLVQPDSIINRACAAQ